MVWVISLFTLLGINFSIWTIIGVIRFNLEKIKIADIEKNYKTHSFFRWVFIFIYIIGVNYILQKIVDLILAIKQKMNVKNREYIKKLNNQVKINFVSPKISPAPSPLTENDVAAIIPAHNEELTIAKTIASLKVIMPAHNIYIGSDASTDRTVAIARNLGCQLADIFPNKGKAGVLTYLLHHFKLIERYKAVMIVDADSEISPTYLKKALPLFADPEVAAVAVHALSKWQNHPAPKWSMIFTAYRIRLFRVLQAVMRYGQTWKYTNMTTIVPGFASIYRTSVLKDIKIDAPGLIIEDYNMTFEIHHKKLGKIAYDPQITGLSHDPINFQDYFKQVKRWNLGFWQTIRSHGFWPSWFCFSLSLYIIEMFIYAIFLLAVPLLILMMAINSFAPLTLPFSLPILHISQLTILDLLIGVLLIDYLVTAVVAIYEKKLLLLLYGLGFIFFRYLDAFIFLYTLPLAFIVKSEGKWVSPKRPVLAT